MALQPPQVPGPQDMPERQDGPPDIRPATSSDGRPDAREDHPNTRRHPGTATPGHRPPAPEPPGPELPAPGGRPDAFESAVPESAAPEPPAPESAAPGGRPDAFESAAPEPAAPEGRSDAFEGEPGVSEGERAGAGERSGEQTDSGEDGLSVDRLVAGDGVSVARPEYFPARDERPAARPEGFAPRDGQPAARPEYFAPRDGRPAGRPEDFPGRGGRPEYRSDAFEGEPGVSEERRGGAEVWPGAYGWRSGQGAGPPGVFEGHPGGVGGWPGGAQGWPGRPEFRPPLPSPEPPAVAPPRRPTVLGLRSRQWLAVGAVVVVGYFLVAVVAVTVMWETFNRSPTNAELQRAAAAEVARRWQEWPAGRIFPERLPYVPYRAESEFATRVGIAPGTRCADAVDAASAAVLRKHGCRAVLRATYTDQLQGIVVTIGVAVFPDDWTAYRARRALPGTPTALRALPFPGTVAARFDDAARQVGTAERGGPYIVFTTAGQADGRPADRIRKRRPGDIFGLAPQLAHTIARTLSMRALPDCSSDEWKC